MKLIQLERKYSRFDYGFWPINQITFDNDFGTVTFAKKGKLIFNKDIQEELLHSGKPNIFVDSRFDDFTTSLFVGKSKKAIFRNLSKYKSIYDKPLKIEIPNKYVGIEGLLAIVEPSEKITFINDHKSNLHIEDEWLKELTTELINNGFIIFGAFDNVQFLFGDNDPGQIITAYGHGKCVGISSGEETFRGYTNGKKHVLWDKFGEFDKWSRCNEIPKTTPIKEIINQLIKK